MAKFEVCGTGWVPTNKRRWKNAGLLLYRPAYGIISIAFAESKNGKPCVLVHECECKSHRILGDGCAIDLDVDRVHEIEYSKRDLPSGDLRDMVDIALKKIGWPLGAARYFLVSKTGEFWDHPLPMGAKTKEGDQ